MPKHIFKPIRKKSTGLSRARKASKGRVNRGRPILRRKI